MKCHYGIELPDDPSKPCPKCGARMGETCGRAYQAGFRAGYNAAIDLLRNRTDFILDSSNPADWLSRHRPPEPL